MKRNITEEIIWEDDKAERDRIINDLLYEWVEKYLSSHFLDLSNLSPLLELQQLREAIIRKSETAFNIVLTDILKKGISQGEDKSES